MTRWQIIRVLLIVAYRVFVRRDYLGLLRDLLPKDAPPVEPMKHHPSAMGFVPELRKMVRGGGAHLLVVLILAGVAMAAGQITVTGYPPVPVTIKGGVGIDIVGKEIRATGVAVPVSIQPWSNISSASRGNLAPYSVATAFTNFTTVDRATVTQLNAGLSLKSPVFANYTTLARFGAGPTYNGLPIASGGVAGVQTFNARTGNVLPTSGDYSIGQIAGAATVATTGSYNDLSNKPTLSTVAATGSYTDLLNKPTLSTVASTGSYNDLLNKPATYTLPTATTTVLGGVKVDGTSVVIDGAGVISSTVSAGVSSVDGATGVVSLTGVYKTQAAFNNFSSQQATQDAAQDTAFRNYTTNDRLTRSELSPRTDLDSTTTPASVAGVKAAYDLANGKLSPTGDGSGLTGITAGQVGVRERLTADRTYYVATTGSDSNNGLTAGTPFLTIQKAINSAALVDMGLFNIIIQLADGTYNQGTVSVTSTAANTSWQLTATQGGTQGQFIIQGNATTPGNVIIQGGLGTPRNHTVVASNGARLTIKNLKLTSTTTGGSDLLQAQIHSYVGFSNIIFGSMGDNSTSHIWAESNGTVAALGPYTIEAGAGRHVYVKSGSTIWLNQPVTINNNVTFATAFAEAESGGVIVSYNLTKTGTGTVTGKKFYVHDGGVVEDDAANVNQFPGSLAGESTLGGRYKGQEYYEKLANKGQANGYAALSSAGLVLTSQLAAGTANNTTYLRGDGTWVTPPTGGAGIWGSITGTLSDQTDLNNVLTAKAPAIGPTISGPSGVSSGAVTMTASANSFTFTTSSSITLNAGDYIIPTTTTAQARQIKVGGTGTSFTVENQFFGAVSGEAFTVYSPIKLLKDHAGNNKGAVQGYTGYLGVGTASPQYGVHLQSATSPYVGAEGVGLGGGNFVARNYNGASDPAAGDLLGATYFIGNNTLSNLSGTAATISGAADATGGTRIKGRITFSTSDGTSNSERMRIDSVGNVGIGTAAPGEKLEVNGHVKAKVFAPAISAAATDGATVTFDLAAGDSPSVTLGGNRTLAFSNPVTGAWYSLKLIQDATGSRTVTWPSSGLVCTFIKSDGTQTATGPTLHTAANTVDTIVVHVKSSTTADCWAAGY